MSNRERGYRFGADLRTRRALVGNALYHTVGEREAAVNALVVDFDRAYSDLGHAVGVLPYEGSAERVKAHPTWYVWWMAAADPIFRAWTKFKSEQLGGDTTGPGGAWIAYSNRFGTDWSVYEEWVRRLETLRASARNMGIKLTTPEPTKLPTTIVEDLENLGHDLKDKAGEGWTLAKVAIYGGLGLVGVIALTSVVSNMRSGSDPVVTWRKALR